MGDQSSIRRRLVRGSTVMLLATLVVTPLAVFRSVIVARLLEDPDLIGLLGIYGSITALFGVLAGLGIPTAVARYYGQFIGGERENSMSLIRASFMMTTVLSFSLGVLLFALSGFLAAVYNRPDLVPLLQVGAVTVAITSIAGFFAGSLRGLQRMTHLGSISIVRSSLAVVTSFSFVLLFGVLGAAYAILLSAAGALLVSYFLFREASRDLGIRYGQMPNRASVAGVARYSLPLVASGLVLYPSLLVAESFLAVQVSFGALGLYRIGFGFYALLISIPGILAVPLMPMIAEMREREPDRVNQIITQIFSYLTFSRTTT